MSKKSFFRLLRLLKDDLMTIDVRAISSSGSPVTPLIKLAATIRWLVSAVLRMCSCLRYHLLLFCFCLFFLSIYSSVLIFLLLNFNFINVILTQAGGMYIDICGLFGLSQSSFFNPLHGPLWPTIHALDIALADHVVFNTDVSSCAKAAVEFSHFSRGMLNHCVCAVDGFSLHLFSYCNCNVCNSYPQTILKLVVIYYVPNKVSLFTYMYQV